MADSHVHVKAKHTPKKCDVYHTPIFFMFQAILGQHVTVEIDGSDPNTFRFTMNDNADIKHIYQAPEGMRDFYVLAIRLYNDNFCRRDRIEVHLLVLA